MSMDLNRKKSFIPLIYHQIQEKEPSHTNDFQGQWKSIANILHSLRLLHNLFARIVNLNDTNMILGFNENNF